MAHCFRHLIFLVFGLVASLARADYRAYELTITNADTGATRTVVSTLDHLQYPGYHPLSSREIIRLSGTWRCLGPSYHYRPICPRPAPAPAQKPNSVAPA